MSRREWPTVPIPGMGKFQARYDETVTNLPFDPIEQPISGGAPGPDTMGPIDAIAPYGFLIYFTDDVHPVRANAGDQPSAQFAGLGTREAKRVGEEPDHKLCLLFDAHELPVL